MTPEEYYEELMKWKEQECLYEQAVFQSTIDEVNQMLMQVDYENSEECRTSMTKEDELEMLEQAKNEQFEFTECNKDIKNFLLDKGLVWNF